MIKLDLTNDIDQNFVAIVERVLNNTLLFYKPAGVYVILVDNWFDHKWLEFNSNKIDNDLSGWRNKLELPPFEPSRILNQSYFHMGSSAPLLYEAFESKPLHILSTRRSVGEMNPSGVFMWYSYVDQHSDNGSLMVYLSEDRKGSAWYASLTKNPDWHVNRMKGISNREFTELMKGPNSTDGTGR